MDSGDVINSVDDMLWNEPINQPAWLATQSQAGPQHLEAT